MPDGHVGLLEDGGPEARRRRLWGAVWQQHRMPLLPCTSDLVDALSRHGLPPEVIHAIHEASSAVDLVLDAKARSAELERSLQTDDLSAEEEAAAEVEFLPLLAQADMADDLLCSYALTLADNLPVLRNACRAE
ncbi:hypothetical protein [Spirillospora sp. CA-294931]|uniref:hypothetical protein n=1 Tax=Spirillospora sp. CA-294931 TaxID=3240042 RepID=UPI003D8E5785